MFEIAGQNYKEVVQSYQDWVLIKACFRKWPEFIQYFKFLIEPDFIEDIIGIFIIDYDLLNQNKILWIDHRNLTLNEYHLQFININFDSIDSKKWKWYTGTKSLTKEHDKYQINSEEFLTDLKDKWNIWIYKEKSQLVFLSSQNEDLIIQEDTKLYVWQNQSLINSQYQVSEDDKEKFTSSSRIFITTKDLNVLKVYILKISKSKWPIKEIYVKQVLILEDFLAFASLLTALPLAITNIISKPIDIINSEGELGHRQKRIIANSSTALIKLTNDIEI